jgi:hypothetical protein
MPADKKTRKSPLKQRPLRLPGQSIQDEIDRLLYERILSYGFVNFMLVLVAFVQWVLEWSTTRVNPWCFTILAAVAIPFSAYKIRQDLKKIESLKLGRDGERIVAEQLESLREQGAIVLHDIVGSGFNVDHVVVSNKGVFVVETKTRSKPARGSAKVTYDGKVLLVDGMEPDRDPIAQVLANADWIRKELQAATGKSYPVRPVVLFPGWFVDPTPRGCSVWVLEPKALPSFVEHERVKVVESDLHYAVYVLTGLARLRSL